MARSTGYGLWAWRSDKHGLKRWLKNPLTWRSVGIAAVVVALLALIPVRLSALAPAEISPLRPIPVTSPVEGVVREIVVKPNEIVKADQLLAVLDDTSLRNRLELAEQGARHRARRPAARHLQVVHRRGQPPRAAGAQRARAGEGRRGEPSCRSCSASRSSTAPQGGLAIFPGQDEWRGRPVQVGERVMLIADPSLIDVTIYLPPEDAVELEPGAEVNLILHVDPLSLATRPPSSARATKPSLGPDGTLAYVVRARAGARARACRASACAARRRSTPGASRSATTCCASRSPSCAARSASEAGRRRRLIAMPPLFRPLLVLCCAPLLAAGSSARWKRSRASSWASPPRCRTG